MLDLMSWVSHHLTLIKTEWRICNWFTEECKQYADLGPSMRPEASWGLYFFLHSPQVIHSLFLYCNALLKNSCPKYEISVHLTKVMCLGVKAQGTFRYKFLAILQRTVLERTVWEEHYTNFNCTINFDIHKIFKFLLPQAQFLLIFLLVQKRKKVAN